MKFAARKELRNHGQELVNLIIGTDKHNLVFKKLTSDGDLTVAYNDDENVKYELHAYVEDFRVNGFRRELMDSVIYGYKSDEDFALKYLMFMTKIFGESYVQAFEKWIEQQYLCMLQLVDRFSNNRIVDIEKFKGYLQSIVSTQDTNGLSISDQCKLLENWYDEEVKSVREAIDRRYETVKKEADIERAKNLLYLEALKKII